MPITKSITLESGLVVTHHKVVSIAISNATGQERVVASIASWVDKTFADNNPQTPAYRLGAILLFPPQPGMYALAETAVVADPTCKLFGGTVTLDVIVSDLDAAKLKKKAEIASARSVEMYADKTTSLGVFGSTESDNNKLSLVIQVTQLAAALGNPAECGYKTVDGVYSVYTLAQLEQIALEIAAQVVPLYEKEASLVALVDAATTVADVDLINW